MRRRSLEHTPALGALRRMALKPGAGPRSQIRVEVGGHVSAASTGDQAEAQRVPEAAHLPM